MAKKRTKKRKTAAARRKTAQPSAPPAPPASTPEAAAQDRFVRDLLVRGDAQELDQQGKLPTPATHRITKRKPDGTAEVQRVRFKTF